MYPSEQRLEILGRPLCERLPFSTVKITRCVITVFDGNRSDGREGSC